MWPAVKKFFPTVEGFDQYVNALGDPIGWTPEFVVMHNTGAPTLSSWVHGGATPSQRMANLESFYRDTQKWSGGPHLFIDPGHGDSPAGIWVFNDLRYHGVHSPSWNSVSYGIEMVGDYSQEDFATAGHVVGQLAAGAAAVLCKWRGFDSSTIRFHKEDPLTTHKDCPGRSVDKAAFLQAVHNAKLALS